MEDTLRLYAASYQDNIVLPVANPSAKPILKLEHLANGTSGLFESLLLTPPSGFATTGLELNQRDDSWVFTHQQNLLAQGITVAQQLVFSGSEDLDLIPAFGNPVC